MRINLPPGQWNPNALHLELTTHHDFTVLYEMIVEGGYDELLGLTQPGDVVVDAGANIGLFSLLASLRVGPSGRVIAIEPEPGNLARLREHVRMNDAQNVTVVPLAVDARSGETRRMTGSGIRAHLSEEGTTLVRTTSLDDVVYEFGARPAILKMDIEGSEATACVGMTQTMRSVRAMAIEVHDPLSESRVSELLRAFRVRPVRARSLSKYLRYASRHPILMARLEVANGFSSLRKFLFERAGKLAYVDDRGYPVDWIAWRQSDAS